MRGEVRVPEWVDIAFGRCWRASARVCSARRGVLTLIFVPWCARSGSVSVRGRGRFRVFRGERISMWHAGSTTYLPFLAFSRVSFS